MANASKSSKSQDTPQIDGAAKPIEIVRTKPELGNEEAEVVTVNNKPNLQESDAPAVTADEEASSQPKFADKTPIQMLIDDLPKEVRKAWTDGRIFDEDGVAEDGFDITKIENMYVEASRAKLRNLGYVI